MSLFSRLARCTAIAILLACVFGAGPAANADQYRRLVVFGDSLSDNGNFFAVTAFPPPPYFMGRFSNGPVWVEDLAKSLDVPLDDFAFAGATTGTTNVNNPPGLQVFPGIQSLIGDSTSGYIGAHPVADPKALYVIWGGANDYLGGGLTDPTLPVANLIAEIRRLAATGAKHFLIANLPDLGTLPEFRGSVISAPLNYLTAVHNALLAQALAGLRDQRPGNDIDIVLFDVNTLVRKTMTTPAAFGLTNVIQAYLSSPSGSPDPYLFWDTIHPTATGHRILANAAYAAVHDNRKEK